MPIGGRNGRFPVSPHVTVCPGVSRPGTGSEPVFRREA